jgi:hypothetical protein
MKASQFRGAVLEYLVRSILANCGFSAAVSDGLYSFERNGLFFVNGKGAAHDADVLMDPPFQIPFTYPARVLFECKAYGSPVGLPTLRGALGLRYDINEFEIVTRESIARRQNNRRASYAVEPRTRCWYEVGVASFDTFTKPAIEFATNNKIQLLSMTSLLANDTAQVFSSIDDAFLARIGQDAQIALFRFFKDKHATRYSDIHASALRFVHTNDRLRAVVADFDEAAPRLFVGILENGDMIFLRDESPTPYFFERIPETSRVVAQIHYRPAEPDLWYLTLSEGQRQDIIARFSFFLPRGILDRWVQIGLDRASAINIKQEFFSRLFIFTRGLRHGFPFVMVDLDREWVDGLWRDQR